MGYNNTGCLRKYLKYFRDILVLSMPCKGRDFSLQTENNLPGVLGYVNFTKVLYLEMMI